jgi:hypothetical protein
MAKAVTKSASRSLGLLITKCKANGGFEYSTFTKQILSILYVLENSKFFSLLLIISFDHKNFFINPTVTHLCKSTPCS